MISGTDDVNLSASVEPEPTLKVTPLPDGSGFSLTGTIDLSTAATARDRLDAAWRPGATVGLELSGLEFIDSTGLNLICRGLVTLGDRGPWSSGTLGGSCGGSWPCRGSWTARTSGSPRGEAS